MATYSIEETTAVHARRQGVTKDFSSLSAAKRFASKNQAFYGTVLSIYVRDELIAYKSHKRWFDVRED